MIIIDIISQKQIKGYDDIDVCMREKYEDIDIIESKEYYEKSTSYNIDNLNHDKYLLFTADKINYSLYKVRLIKGRYYESKTIKFEKTYRVQDNLFEIKEINFNDFDEKELINYDLATVEKIINIKDYHIIPKFENVKKVIFSHSMKGNLPEKIFPISVEHIELYSEFDQEITSGLFPPRIKYLKFFGKFNKILYNLPNSIEELVFDSKSSFNQYIAELPSNLRVLGLNNMYNIPFEEGVFPASFEELYLGDQYDCKIEKNSFSTNDDGSYNLKVFCLGDAYNFKFNPGDIPDSVKKFICGFSYDHFFEEGTFSDNLKFLFLGDQYDHPLTNIPSSVEAIFGSWKFNKNINFTKFPNLKVFEMNGCFNKLPKISNSIEFPDSIKCLKLGYNIKDKIDHFPSNLEKLVLQNYDHSLDNLPDGIEEVHIEKFGGETIVYPSSVKKIKYRVKENEILNKTMFPANLEELSLHNFNQDLDENTFPDNLKILRILDTFNKQIPESCHKDGLEIILHEKYNMDNLNH